MEWRQTEVLDANVWLAETDAAAYRIIERKDRRGHFEAQERKLDEETFIDFMSANTLDAAKSASKTYSETIAAIETQAT